MKIRLLKIWLLAAVTTCLLGCHKQVDMQQCRVVTGVSVTYLNGPIQCQRQYTNADKMQQILNYLRTANPYGVPAEDPEAAEGSDFYIVLSYSDGCQKYYRQKANRFLRDTDGIWKKLDPSRAEKLGQIIGQMESDAP